MTNGLIQHIAVEESTSIQWVKVYPYTLKLIGALWRMLHYNSQLRHAIFRKTHKNVYLFTSDCIVSCWLNRY